MVVDPEHVLRFWFEELDPEDWFAKDSALDQLIRQRFLATYEALSEAVPASWLANRRGTLAAVIVLDQFPRNLFRDDPRSFATDATALEITKRALDQGLEREMDVNERQFLYMPFQHVEDAEEQARSVILFAELDESTLGFARRHQAVIDRFGRFPHRNAVLGRQSTPAEIEFLKEPGSSF